MERGFSLLELSIVLVIIGLITGGIMAGRSMVRAAEVRSIMVDVQKYQAAVNTFREKYNGLPGDLKTAVRYWGAQAGGTADGIDSTCHALTYTSPATGTATCNGDGNGQISSANLELWRFWQHLANAGLIEGQYIGVPAGSYVLSCQPGTNCPTMKITGATMGVRYVATQSGVVGWYDGFYGNLFEIGTLGSAGTNWPDNGVTPMLTAAEAYGIDTKFDDSLPGTGIIMGMKSAYWSTNCTTTDVVSTAAWAISASQLSCGLIAKPGF